MTSSQPLNEYQTKLVETHVGLAQHIALRFWRKAPAALDRDDLVSVAYQGLVTAALRFDVDYRPPNDPNYDPFLAFGSFARTRITGSVQDWLRTIDHVPRRHRRLYRNMSELPPGTTPDEMAAQLGVDVARVKAVTSAVESPPVHLSALEQSPTSQITNSSQDTETTFTANSIQEAVARAIEEMADFEKSVIVLRYYLGYDFARIAEELGSSTSRVRASHQESVLLIHEVMLKIVQP